MTDSSRGWWTGERASSAPSTQRDGLAQVVLLARSVPVHEALGEGGLDEREQQLGDDPGIERAQRPRAPASRRRPPRAPTRSRDGSRRARRASSVGSGASTSRRDERALLAHVGEGPAQHRLRGRLARAARRRRRTCAPRGRGRTRRRRPRAARACEREVMEDGALGDAGLARELRRGGGGVAALGEQAARRVEQALALAAPARADGTPERRPGRLLRAVSPRDRRRMGPRNRVPLSTNRVPLSSQCRLASIDDVGARDACRASPASCKMNSSRSLRGVRACRIPPAASAAPWPRTSACSRWIRAFGPARAGSSRRRSVWRTRPSAAAPDPDPGRRSTSSGAARPRISRCVRSRSQIAVLNRDFRARAPDRKQVPAVWQGLVGRRGHRVRAREPRSRRAAQRRHHAHADARARRSGPATRSSRRRPAARTRWPSDRYLNLWVCTLSGGLLGYAQFPGGPKRTDGVVITASAFGDLGQREAALRPRPHGRARDRALAEPAPHLGRHRGLQRIGFRRGHAERRRPELWEAELPARLLRERPER